MKRKVCYRPSSPVCFGVHSAIRLICRMAMVTATLLVTFAVAPCRAGYSEMTDSGNPAADYFANWFPRVTQIQSEQPRWITPLVTVTPRLEQEYRYDQSWTTMNSKNYPQVDNYGTTKGVELIPFDPVELIIGIPDYETENHPHKWGWADETFLVKHRILSGNEENGDYILTAFMGLSVPSGSDDFSSHHFGFTPTIAGGKGWGNFDVQTTLGFSIPNNGFVRTGGGSSLAWNTALQYRVCKLFWPEVEANYTWYATGTREGLNQLMITSGIVIGRIPIAGRVGLTLGVGCQFPLTDEAVIHRNVILSGRIPF
ncbi:MAG TPA: hypothetical protein VNV43_00660 [Candidatus Acidoferrales bacterium]|nr:hypothetical protein [Candidatus Acidoferrales bacterium]